ncbi:kinesin-like protein KIF19 isoform X2 [Chrysoperla carnea]|uniref:kinesin-like protein KIF19 isoform X2 n=1 Tax=Chrysoperla carnea TaxID=189513 RepID=UPI001D0828DA|nr:kinesin-like protein KIF19 isoform X2 [Chrysoperla carnea]
MVAVRVRPLQDDTQRVLHVLNEKTVMFEEDGDKNDVLRQKRGGGDRQFTYDVVFNEDATTDQVYEVTTSGLVKDVLMGYNATVFAYGATGAGKTHTMVGDNINPGIMARAINDLFNAVADSEHPEQFNVTISCMEIYNEQIRDLLKPSSGYLELREDSKGKNIQVTGLTELSTTSTEEVLELLLKANKSRTVEPTAVNKTSSRSHALVSVTVKQTIPANYQQTASNNGGRLHTSVRQGRLFMIDLAGSERANKTKNRGKRLQEGAHINRSLLALGNCINALSGGARYVNFRDSKLTRLLKDALSGNCRTVMIAHVSPAAASREESRNTLIYADRANKISTKSEQNIMNVGYHITQYQTVINELRNEISRLKTKMQEDRPRSGQAERISASQRSNEIKMLREQIVETFKEQMKLRRRLMEIDTQLLSLGMDAERQHMIISNWESRNNKLYKSNRNSTSRARTQQSLRRKQQNTSDSSGTNGSNDGDSYVSDGEIEGGELAVQQAWAELAEIEKEQERWHDERQRVEEDLELCRQHGVALEDELPSRISTDDERELLALLCRVHELEADKLALQGERIARMHELKRRDTALLRCERQRQISDAIITRQRQIMEEGSLNLPPDLQELYQLYQQEIYASTYTDPGFYGFGSTDRLPSIGRGYGDSLFSGRRKSPDSDGTYPSSADSDYAMSPLPPLNESFATNAPVEDRLMGQLVPPPTRGGTTRFPPIPTANSLPSKLRKPIFGFNNNMRRTSSVQDIITLDNKA